MKKGMTEEKVVPTTSYERLSVLERARGSKRGRSLRESESDSERGSKRTLITLRSNVSVRIVSVESSEAQEYSKEEQLGYDPSKY